MADYVLSCGTSEDLTKKHFEEIGVHYCAFPYSIDGKEYLDDLGETIPYDKFYQMMAEGKETSTSQINMEGYKNYFRPFLEKGLDILHLVLSSGLTGTINSCNMAVEELKEEFPNNKIYVVDSLGACGGNGIIMDTLSRMKKEGKTIEELYKWVEENKLRMNYLFFSTDLKYYVRGGRISKTAGMIGGALKICPLLYMDTLGKLVVIGKIRTKQAVIKAIVDKMEELVEDGLNYSKQVYINHAGCLEDALAVKKLVEERFKNIEPVVINSIGTTIGAHTGPGTVALFFWGKENRQ